MRDEMATQTERRRGVRQFCYRGGHVLHLRACLSRVIDETERELMLRECRLLASANPLVRFGC
jgi:hypothetical protein